MEVYFTLPVTTSEGVCFSVHVLNLIKEVRKNCEKFWAYFDSTCETVKLDL